MFRPFVYMLAGILDLHRSLNCIYQVFNNQKFIEDHCKCNIHIKYIFDRCAQLKKV